MEREAAFRRDGDDACRMRIERLSFEINEYFVKLAAQEAIAAVKAERRQAEEEKRQADELHRAMETTARIVNGRDVRAQARAAAPPLRQSGPYSIAPWARR